VLYHTGNLDHGDDLSDQSDLKAAKVLYKL
jgi:hypothetical protein